MNTRVYFEMQNLNKEHYKGIYKKIRKVVNYAEDITRLQDRSGNID